MPRLPHTLHGNTLDRKKLFHPGLDKHEEGRQKVACQAAEADAWMGKTNQCAADMRTPKK